MAILIFKEIIRGPPGGNPLLVKRLKAWCRHSPDWHHFFYIPAGSHRRESEEEIIYDAIMKMKQLKLALFIIAGLLAIAWILGFFIFSAGTFIHILVISAALFFMQAVIVTPKPQPISD